MATKDGSPLDDLFPSGHAEPKQPDIGNAWDRAVISSRILKMSILVCASHEVLASTRPSWKNDAHTVFAVSPSRHHVVLNRSSRACMPTG
jgi:hypothetical protein